MDKKLVFAIAIFLVSPAAAEVQYSMDADKQKNKLNVSIELECNTSCPVSNWRLDWSVPENAEILGIKDTEGEIETYTRDGQTLSISTNKGGPKESERLKIRMLIDEKAEEIHDGWYRRRISLPGFERERLSGSAKVDQLISGWIGYGFDSSYSPTEMRFRGEGPTNIRINFGNGTTSKYYEFFGNRPQQPDEAYRIAVGTIKKVPGFQRFPAAVIPGEKYNRTVNSWSSGEYVSGSIRIREGLGDSFMPVLTHETVHGINERELKWDGTDSAYFDEGTSEYAEFLMTKKLYREEKIDIGPQNIFGGKKTYPTRDGGRGYYTISSKGNKELLWEYYQSNSEFMKTWSPQSGGEFREFGYAYSELLVRNHIMRNRSLDTIYDSMDSRSRIDSSEAKWEFYSKNMEMEPCNFDDRSRFDSCLENINSFDYPIYRADPNIDRREIQIEELKVEERKPTESLYGKTASFESSLASIFRGFLDYVLSFI